MNWFFSITLILALGTVTMTDAADQGSKESVPAALDFKVKDIKGDEIELSKYQGRVLLVVNVASKCGLTPHYKGLEELHEKYADRGLSVLGFPCNQFGKQEPGTEAQILDFCRARFDVKFDMFAKIDVNGDNQAPLYKHLNSLDVEPKGAGDVSWNFEKYLIDRHGKVIARFAPRTEPNDPALVKLLEEALAAK